tara:strand:+ start:1175 stop:1411 length:237 start_codon:yes stop_codon:yes gene_type:complete
MIKENLINGIVLEHIATGYPEVIALNSKEMQLALDNGPNVNKSWELLCESVKHRLGVEIEDNYFLEELVVGGVARPLH